MTNFYCAKPLSETWRPCVGKRAWVILEVPRKMGPCNFHKIPNNERN